MNPTTIIPGAAGTVEQPVTGNATNLTDEVDAPNATPASPDIDTLLAEAEQRGYLRGRNEAIEKLMANPNNNAPLLGVIPMDDDHDILIFEAFPRSIWD